MNIHQFIIIYFYKLISHKISTTLFTTCPRVPSITFFAYRILYQLFTLVMVFTFILFIALNFIFYFEFTSAGTLKMVQYVFYSLISLIILNTFKFTSFVSFGKYIILHESSRLLKSSLNLSKLIING